MKKGGKNNLEQENESLRKENARLSAENERLRQEVKLLNEKIDWLMKKMFGSSSEALNANQLDLFAVLPEAQAPEPDGSLLAAAMIPEKPKTKSKRRERIPENLPAEKVVIDPPEVLANPEKWCKRGRALILDICSIRGEITKLGGSPNVLVCFAGVGDVCGARPYERREDRRS